MNILHISECSRFIEWWNNGKKCFSVHIKRYGLHIAVQMARDHCENWTREKSEIGKDLQAQLNASDNLLSKLAFGADYK